MLLGNLSEVGDESRGQRVPGQDVHAAAEDDGGRGGEVFQQALELRLYLLPGAAPDAGGLFAGEFEQVIALVVVEVEGLCERTEDRLGGVEAALLQPGVVVGGDRGEQGDLFAAQSRDSTGAGRVGSGRPTVRGLSAARRALRNSPSSLRFGSGLMRPVCHFRLHAKGGEIFLGRIRPMKTSPLFSCRIWCEGRWCGQPRSSWSGIRTTESRTFPCQVWPARESRWVRPLVPVCKRLCGVLP